MPIVRRKSRGDDPESFFRTLEMFRKHRGRATYAGGFPDLPGVETPPEQIALTVESDVGQRINLSTLYREDPDTDPRGIFDHARDILDHDGAARAADGYVERTLDAGHPAFSDLVQAIGCRAIRDAVADKVRVRASYAIFFKRQARENPQDSSWMDAALRLDASAYLIFDRLLDELAG